MIWDILEDKKFSIPPKPVHGRIPNFIGAEKSALRLKTTAEWIKSQIVFCSPDSAQLKVRENVLHDGKTLIMASPRLKKGYIIIHPNKISGHEKTASTIKGAFKFGETLDEFPQVDLVVEGSVAVDLSGGRLGKGGGYGDQEITRLLRENAISKETPLVSTVHEIQIIDSVPVDAHDQKINMIVTPNRVIRIKRTDI